MIVTCEKCGSRYDDTYHWTYCPHEYFPMSTVVSRNGEVIGVAHTVEELKRMLGEE